MAEPVRARRLTDQEGQPLLAVDDLRDRIELLLDQDDRPQEVRLVRPTVHSLAEVAQQLLRLVGLPGRRTRVLRDTKVVIATEHLAKG